MNDLCWVTLLAVENDEDKKFMVYRIVNVLAIKRYPTIKSIIYSLHYCQNFSLFIFSSVFHFI
jgi:hypothetical protein